MKSEIFDAWDGTTIGVIPSGILVRESADDPCLMWVSRSAIERAAHGLPDVRDAILNHFAKGTPNGSDAFTECIRKLTNLVTSSNGSCGEMHMAGRA